MAKQTDKDLARADRERRIAEFGDGVAWTPETRAAVTSDLRMLARMEAQLVWEMGRRLVWVREHMEAGEFEAYLRDDAEISRRSAYRYMAVARRLAPLAARGKLAALPAGKAYALLDLDDDEIAELADTGVTGDLELDKFDRMSSREVRDLARRQDRQLAKGRDQIHALEDQAAELEAALGRRARELSGEFLARAHTTGQTVRELLAMFDDRKSPEEIVRLVGSREAAYDVLHNLEGLAQKVIDVARTLEPQGRRVNVGRKR